MSVAKPPEESQNNWEKSLIKAPVESRDVKGFQGKWRVGIELLLSHPILAYQVTFGSPGWLFQSNTYLMALH